MKKFLLLMAFTFGFSVFAQQSKSTDMTPDQLLKEAAGGSEQASKALYEFNKLVSPWLIAEADGDEAKLKMLIEEGRTTPMAFLNRLPPELRAKVETIARKLEAAKTSGKPAP